MDTVDTVEDFLSAVDSLRENDKEVRTTAHTASVSAEAWATTPAPDTTGKNA